MAEKDPPAIVAMPKELVELLFERLGAPAPSAFDPTMLQEILQASGLATAAAMQKAIKPENQFHPGVSVYSYPEGDRDKPRPKLRCRMSWVGAPIDPETEHWYELELLNQAQPGEYTVTNADMSTTTLRVIPSTDEATGQLDHLHFLFPVRDGQKNVVSPKAVWLLEAQGRTYMEAMTTWLHVMTRDQQQKAAKAAA